MFTLFGSNGFLHFLQQPPPPSAFALQFFTAISGSHYAVLIFAVQLLAGILLLLDCFASLAPVMLAAVLANILDFHLTMDPGGIGAAQTYRANFRGLLALKARSA
jgi:hypothetical protein